MSYDIVIGFQLFCRIPLQTNTRKSGGRATE